MKVSDVMKRRVHIVSEDTPLTKAVSLMERHNFKELPVIKGDVLLGKISFYDIMESIRIHGNEKVGKFVKSALNKGYDDVGEMTSCTLEEVAKFIVNEIDLTYLEIRDLYVGIINCLEDIAKQLFKHNKNISVQLLMLSFENLKKLFSQDKMKNHQDTTVIQQNIRRVLTEFETLQTILKSMPPMPRGEPPQE